MKRHICIALLALVLIGIGFAWGCGTNTTVVGSEDVIIADLIKANSVFASKFNLVDDNGNIYGLMTVSDKGTPMLSLFNGDDRFVVHMQDEGPIMVLESGNSEVSIMMMESGAVISLMENDEYLFLVRVRDGEGVISTGNIDGVITGVFP